MRVSAPARKAGSEGAPRTPAGYRPQVAAIPLPPRPALALPTDTLPPAGAAGHAVAYEPKWDGFRALVRHNAIWSRHGRDLRPYFPDLTATLTTILPPDLIVDGEIVTWNPATSRLDFAALSGRFTAGKRIREWAANHPAQFVAFDVLADGAEDLRPLPLIERQVILADALDLPGPAITLCPQTLDLTAARDWISEYARAGVEGLVIKRLDQEYRPAPARIW
jgi:ATP-dependent DNA ligase